jgi:hypothetical protein
MPWVGHPDLLVSSFYSMGAAEDGRAPTEELPSIDEWYFCSTETAEEDRRFD